MRRRAGALLAATTLALALLAGAPTRPGATALNPAATQGRGAHGESPATQLASPHSPGVILLAFHDGVSRPRQHAIERAAGAYRVRHLGPPIRPAGRGHVTGAEFLAPLALRLPAARLQEALESLRADPTVAYAEPDYLQTADATPNDPSFSLQWGDSNTGQAIPTQGADEKLGSPVNGTAGADDRAALDWAVSTGSRSIVVGDIDSGLDYEHPDLAANTWSNPGGVGGCAAGTHGYNVLAKTCNPIDADASYGGHGTHVGGILGAVGNNGIGVAGMNWQTTILPVRWMNNASSGETSALIEALQWLVSAKQAGVNVRVANDSDTFVGTARSQALINAIEVLGANNILFVAAAGNTATNNDETSVQRYPCSYDLANELCVTASNNKDELPSWAGYGAHTVDLAAPGVSIYSTLREGKYGYLSGGSMAAPQVSGAAALILSVAPTMSTAAVRAAIVENVDKLPSLSGKLITGGRLNVCRAMPGCTEPPPPPPPLTFGKTSVGATADYFASERKRVNRYALPAAGSVTKLSIYLAPTSTSGQQVLKGVIYSDAAGKPEALLGVSEQLAFSSTSSAGWYDLPFASPVSLAAGNYWIGVMTGPTNSVAGFRYDSVSGARDYNANTYSAGPSNPFGAVTTDSEQASLYATYTTAAVPVNSSPPTISGTPQQGKTLTESHGIWTNSPTSYAYQWQQCNGEGSGCTAISGATNQTYLLTPGDAGHTIRIQETAKNASGASAPATSAATAVVLPLPPANTSLPTLTGTPQQGKTLTESHGTWTNSPTSYAYQWQQCNGEGSGCNAISGATNQTYALTAGDVGHTIRVQETASNAGGASSPAISAASAVVVPPPPSNTTLPAIGGTAQEGQTLTESHGAWTNNPTSFAYQWLQCDGEGNGCAAIAGATAQTYVLSPGDVGHKLRVQETASNAGGSSSPATSAPSPAVVPLPPENSAPPTITGTAQQGQTLTEHHGTWTKNPTSFAYQWLRCESLGGGCLPIAGATGQTYVAGPEDVGQAIAVQETASNAGGASAPVSSARTGTVLPAGVAPAATASPTISGTAQQGQTLTEHSGSWSNEPTSFAYQWLRCDGEGNGCQPISSATGQTYVPGQTDVEHTIRVSEEARNAFGAGTATSQATAVVLPAPPVNVAPPAITGTAQQGQTLTEQHGTWENNPTAFAYQWLQCDPLGEGCLPISGASGQTYVPTASDVGHTLRVSEQASNAGGSGPASTSAATATVSAPPETAKIGTTTVGSSVDSFTAGRKRTNRYALPVAGTVTKLSIYLATTGKAGQQVMRGVIYSDASGKPKTLLAVSEELTYSSSEAAGWHDLTLASPLKLAAGSYWIGVITGPTPNVAGFRYQSVPESRDYNADAYADGPASSFGAPNIDGEQASLFATYTPG